MLKATGTLRAALRGLAESLQLPKRSLGCLSKAHSSCLEGLPVLSVFQVLVWKKCFSLSLPPSCLGAGGLQGSMGSP